MLNILGKIFNKDILKNLSYFSQKIGFDISCKLSPFAWKVKPLFLGKNKKNISICRLLKILLRVPSIKQFWTYPLVSIKKWWWNGKHCRPWSNFVKSADRTANNEDPDQTTTSQQLPETRNDFINVIVNALIILFMNWQKIMLGMANYYWSTFKILTKQHIAKYTTWMYLHWLLKKKKNQTHYFSICQNITVLKLQY